MGPIQRSSVAHLFSTMTLVANRDITNNTCVEKREGARDKRKSQEVFNKPRLMGDWEIGEGLSLRRQRLEQSVLAPGRCTLNVLFIVPRLAPIFIFLP